MGENLTTSGLDEASLRVGDRLQIGDVVLEVNQPRIPCVNLNVRLNRKDAVRLFLDSGKYGVYYRVLQDGIIQEGDSITFIGRESTWPEVSLSDLAQILMRRKVSTELSKRVLSLPYLDPYLLKTLKK